MQVTGPGVLASGDWTMKVEESRNHEPNLLKEELVEIKRKSVLHQQTSHGHSDERKAWKRTFRYVGDKIRD